MRSGLICFAFCVACKGDGKSTTPDSGWTPTDDSGPTQGAEWEDAQLADLDIGTQTEMVVAPDGTVQLATWSNAPWVDGKCKDTPKQFYDLHFAEQSGSSWTTELIDSIAVVFTPMGVGLSHDSSGDVTVAYMGGEAKDAYCGGHDLVMAQRSGGWAPTTMATDSGQSATGDAASDAGYVVGMWPALAYDAAGTPAAAHRDTHFGTLQHDDTYRADLEFAYNGHEVIDMGEGAGEYNQLFFDDQDRPVAVYAITVQEEKDNRHGVWVSRKDAGKWERVKLHNGSVAESLDAAINPVTGDIVVAIYSPSDDAVKLRTLSDPTQLTDSSAWETTLVASNQFDEGYYVSLAFTADGRTALSYRRCRKISSDEDSCDANDEAVIFALEDDAGDFDIETVREAGSGSCGEYTALAIDSSDTAHIAYRCTVQDDDGDFVFRPFVASRSL